MFFEASMALALNLSPGLFRFSASGETIMEEAEQWGLVRQTEDDEWGAEVELVGGLCKQS